MLVFSNSASDSSVISTVRARSVQPEGRGGPSSVAVAAVRQKDRKLDGGLLKDVVALDGERLESYP
jgi:hypothetical protein